MADLVQLVLGALVLWAPGLAWVWALAPELDWAKYLFASVIVAVTVQPFATYLLNVFLGVPIAPMNYVLLSLGLALLGLGWGLRPRIEESWGAA